MILPATEQSIRETNLPHQDRTLLLSFLNHFSATEQKTLLDIETLDSHLWIKLLIRMKIIKEELNQGAKEVIMHQLIEASEALR